MHTRLHRSERAAFPHPAPASGDAAQPIRVAHACGEAATRTDPWQRSVDATAGASAWLGASVGRSAFTV